MLTVSAREANQQFSKILEVAVAGETVTITRRGVPVAKLVPLGGVPEGAEAEAARQRAQRQEEILKLLDEGFEGGALDDWRRDELYLERFERPRERP